MSQYAIGSLVHARGREWVVLPDSDPELLVVRPLSGGDDEIAGILTGIEQVRQAEFPPPRPQDAGNAVSAGLLRTALQIGFRSTAGPFRSLAGLAVQARPYQLVPLLMALRQETVRLLIADDVGIGKTIEASLIAAELLAQGSASRLAVLCSPALAEQWQGELAGKFRIDAELVLASTVKKLERGLFDDEWIFDRYPYTVVSTDFIKSPRHRDLFIQGCPDLVIVDEAHGCVADGSSSRDRTLRYDLMRRLAADVRRHLLLVTATPHSGKDEGFRNLIGLLDPELANLDLSVAKGRERLARHMVQRRRSHIRKFLEQETAFPSDRLTQEQRYYLTDGYRTLFDAVLSYARETVRDSSGGPLRQRVRYWSALGLLRALASSPKAAAATLRTRARNVDAATVEEADSLGRATVLDLAEAEAAEALDVVPGADAIPEGASPERRRLLELARRADKLAGEPDAKLAMLDSVVQGLLAEGDDPVVFCRFIDTAEYVAEHLRISLGRSATVECVTGTLPPADREARIAELTDTAGRHVLIATGSAAHHPAAGAVPAAPDVAGPGGAASDGRRGGPGAGLPWPPHRPLLAGPGGGGGVAGRRADRQRGPGAGPRRPGTGHRRVHDVATAHRRRGGRDGDAAAGVPCPGPRSHQAQRHLQDHGRGAPAVRRARCLPLPACRRRWCQCRGAAVSRSPFPALRVAGGLLPADLFGRVLEGKDLPGWESAEYGLAPHENVRQAATRAFDYLGGAWQAFTRDRDKAQAEGRPLTGLTRERWLLTVFRALDYGILSTTPAGGLVVEDTAFRVSHVWEHVPIHLLGWGVDLDRRTKGVAGAAEAAPQSMVQELLNRTDAHLWAIVSNGCTLRLLRDSRSLAGSAYVEFDLELIFDEQLFPDFVLLFRLLHASRLAVPAGEPPASCWLEKWRADTLKQGERALERLRVGVKQAITTLGTGFLHHPANSELRARLAAGTLARDDYKRAVLRLVYRLLFWFVAEDRDVLLDPDAPSAARARYGRFFSALRLRDRARRGSLDHHEDLWEAVRLVFTGLGTEQGRPELGVPGLGGLFERVTRDQDDQPIEPTRPDALDEPLEGLLLTNEALITAVRQLAIVDSEGQRRPVDFRNLDSEELGSVYESLLELHPQYDPQEQTFTLVSAAGHERKETGSYYTPTSLTEALLDSALDPVLNDAATVPGDAEAKVGALLGVTVCDPACGSGHFLVAAARRIARRVAQLRSGEHEPSPDLVRTAMREVVSRCIHGVDINEMAAELARVSLWLESVEPGKPLAFLDANIRVGNSLLGTTPALIAAGIPDEAFTPIEGDDRAAAKTIREHNAQERGGQFDLFSTGGLELTNETLAIQTRSLVHSVPECLGDVVVARRRLRGIDAQRGGLRRVADAWCAALVQDKAPDTVLSAITEHALQWIAAGPTSPSEQQVAERVQRLARDYRFFHWQAEFPHIFAVPEGGDVDRATGWRGGFHCVVGNPPWERVKLQDQEFFATRRPDIAGARTAAIRQKMIAALATSGDPVDQRLYEDYRAALRHAEGWSHLLRNSGRYPLTGRGDINTYSVFAETGRTIVAPHGRVGMVLPTGIATDATTQLFFQDLVTSRTLVSLYDFENEDKLFRDVDHRVRFCLWTAAGRSAPQDRIDLAFRLRQVPQIAERRYTLSPEDITLLNPNTGTCPVFDFRRNAEITLSIYRTVPVLWRDGPEGNPWSLSFLRMLDMANDSGLFHGRDALESDGWTLDGNVFVRGDERMLPLVEAKMVHHFDHRLGTYEGQTQAQANGGTLPRRTPGQTDSPACATLPRYWVAETEVDDRLNRKNWDRGWLLGWRDICRSSDVRTVIASAIPRAAIGHTYPLALCESPLAPALYANLCSFLFDYVARQKMAGTHLTYGYLKQLPVLPPHSYDKDCPWAPDQRLAGWVTCRVLELSYTTHDLAPFAQDHGDKGPPFRWDEQRRFWLRAELDAAYFHLYGLPHDDVDYVMDTFRAFRNNDPDRFTRTKKAILDIYDTMTDAIRTGEPYRTVLDPPPGHSPRHAAPRTV